MNSPARNRSFRLIRMMVVAIPALFAVAALAGNATWTSSSGTLWSDGDNWYGHEPAGTDSADTAGNDTATIRGAYQPNIVIDQDVYLAYIYFSQGNGAMAPYTLTSANGGALHICKDGGTITYYATTVADAVVTINCPIVLHRTAAAECNNEEPSSYLVIAGTVTTDGASGREFGLKGYSACTNVLSGTIVNNGDTQVSLVKQNVGAWRVTSTNSTYTGYTGVNEGTLIACSDIYLDRPSAFGMPTRNDYTAIRIGYINPGATLKDAAFLLGLKDDGTGATCHRAVWAYYNNYQDRETNPVRQPAHIGGANTSGTTTYAGQVVLRRSPSFFQCATGGRCVFSGSLTSNDRLFTVGFPGHEGTVDFRSSFSDSGGIVVSNGVMEANCTVTAPIQVDGGMLAGTGTIAGNVAVAAGGTLSGGTAGVGCLSITGDAALAPGAALWFPLRQTASPTLMVGGTLSLEGVSLRVDRPDGELPAGRVVAARADGGIVGTPDLSGVPGFCAVSVSANEIILSFKRPTVVLVR